MKRLNPAPHINVDDPNICPCCGAVWQGAKPWEGKTLSPTEMGAKLGITQQAVTARIRKGTIAAFLVAGRGLRNSYLIPIHEVDRVMSEGGTPSYVEDLAHG